MAVNILLRRGTAAEWTVSNPILLEGEVGVETDSKKLKVGDGLTLWASLPYITLTPTAAASIYATIANPSFTGTVSLGTGVNLVFEGQTANDFETTLVVADPTADRTLTLPDSTGTLATQEYVTSEIGTHNSDTTNVHGIVDTADLATKTYADTAVSTHSSDTTNVHGIVDTADLATKSYADTAASNAVSTSLSTHSSDTLDVHGISDTAALATKTYADTSVSTHNSDTTDVHGIADTSALATKTYADNAVSTHVSDTTDVHGIVDTSALATKTYADTAVSTHSSDTTDVHGIADTAQLATKSYADGAVSTHVSDTTEVHGIADTSALATKTYADTAVSTHASDTTEVHGIADTAQLATKSYADGAVSTHSSDTTEVHGIADTSILVTTTGTQTLTNKTITTPAGLVKSDVGLGNVDNTADASKPVSTATQTALDLKAPKADPTFTGTVSGVTKSHVGLGNVDNTSDADKPVSTATQTALNAKASLAGATFTGNVEMDGNLVVDGDFTVNGTNFSASATSITIEDNMVQLAHQNAANTVDLGLVVAYNDGAAKHSGIVRDVSEDKWKLFKGVTTEPSTTVDFTQGSLDALQVAALEATTVTPSSGVVFSDGTQTKEGTPSRTPIIQKTASYTLSALTERDSLIEVASSSGTTVTIPLNSAVAFPVGTSIDILQTSTGQVTIAGTAGVTVNATPGLKLRTTWSSCTLFKRAENTWVVYGDLTA